MTSTKVSSVEQTRSFKQAVKKLHKNQKKDLDYAVKEIMANPEIGVRKKGDLSYLLVHKFKMNNQLTLLGYSFDEHETLVLTLISVGSHENFYRDLKN